MSTPETGTKEVPNIRTIIIGDTGNTSGEWARKLGFSPRTTGLPAQDMSAEGRDMKLIVSTTLLGSGRFNNETGAQLKGKEAVIIVYDPQDRTSFNNVKLWLQEVDRYGMNGAQKILVRLDPGPTAAVDVDIQEEREFAAQFDIPAIEVDVNDAAGLDHAVFQTVVDQYVKAHPQQPKVNPESALNQTPPRPAQTARSFFDNLVDQAKGLIDRAGKFFSGLVAAVGPTEKAASTQPQSVAADTSAETEENDTQEEESQESKENDAPVATNQERATQTLKSVFDKGFAGQMVELGKGKPANMSTTTWQGQIDAAEANVTKLNGVLRAVQWRGNPREPRVDVAAMTAGTPVAHIKDQAGLERYVQSQQESMAQAKAAIAPKSSLLSRVVQRLSGVIAPTPTKPQRAASVPTPTPTTPASEQKQRAASAPIGQAPTSQNARNSNADEMKAEISPAAKQPAPKRDPKAEMAIFEVAARKATQLLDRAEALAKRGTNVLSNEQKARLARFADSSAEEHQAYESVKANLDASTAKINVDAFAPQVRELGELEKTIAAAETPKDKAVNMARRPRLRTEATPAFKQPLEQLVERFNGKLDGKKLLDDLTKMAREPTSTLLKDNRLAVQILRDITKRVEKGNRDEFAFEIGARNPGLAHIRNSAALDRFLTDIEQSVNQAQAKYDKQRPEREQAEARKATYMEEKARQQGNQEEDDDDDEIEMETPESGVLEESEYQVNEAIDDYPNTEEMTQYTQQQASQAEKPAPKKPLPTPPAAAWKQVVDAKRFSAPPERSPPKFEGNERPKSMPPKVQKEAAMTVDVDAEIRAAEQKEQFRGYHNGLDQDLLNEEMSDYADEPELFEDPNSGLLNEDMTDYADDETSETKDTMILESTSDNAAARTSTNGKTETRARADTMKAPDYEAPKAPTTRRGNSSNGAAATPPTITVNNRESFKATFDAGEGTRKMIQARREHRAASQRDTTRLTVQTTPQRPGK